MRYLRLIVALSALGLSACGTLQGRLVSAPQAAADQRVVILVIRRRWHTDIGFETADLHLPLASLRGRLSGAHYLLFGFGDRHYLMNHSGKAGDLSGALWPGPGLVLVTGLTATPEAAFGADGVIRLKLSATRARDLEEFIWKTLGGRNGAATELAAGPYEGSLYYAATPRYSAVHTCNTWTAEALRAAGFPVRSFGVELSGQVWRQVKGISRQQRAAGDAETSPR